MKILDFIDLVKLDSKSELERAKLLCYYHFKETGNLQFSMAVVTNLMEQCGFSKPNNSRLKDKLIKGKNKVMVISSDNKNSMEFIAVVLQGMENELANAWSDTETIESNSELIDEVKFCGKRGYLDRLIIQINNSYANNCYDACAVLMRRLFEVMLILTYQHFGIDDEIKDRFGTGYIMLDGIVANAKSNTTIKLSRIKREFDTFRKVGNFSAHNITYTAGIKDINDIKLSYRVMLEELYNKSGLIT